MRYAILSDVHGNMPALDAVLDDKETRSIDFVIYLGDAVGYYAESRQVVQILREAVHPHPVKTFVHSGENYNAPTTMPLWVLGNHDWMLLNPSQTDDVIGIAKETSLRTRRDLERDTDILTFLERTPERIEVELESSEQPLSVTIVHASTSDPIGKRPFSYVTNTADARRVAGSSDAQICLVGHTHQPRIFEETPGRSTTWKKISILKEENCPTTRSSDIKPPGEPHPITSNQQLVLNPGSVGQPRDGDNRASYAILDTDARTFTIYRVQYNIEEAQRRARDWLRDISPDMVNELIDRLSTAVG